jgi:DNA-binding transcriptional regulator YiaG
MNQFVNTRPTYRARRNRPPFALLMKELRSQFAGKQICLALALGRTDAAVSMWESGKRVPMGRTMQSIIDALAEAGATAEHLAALSSRWMQARRDRQPRRCAVRFNPALSLPK